MFYVYMGQVPEIKLMMMMMMIMPDKLKSTTYIGYIPF